MKVKFISILLFLAGYVSLNAQAHFEATFTNSGNVLTFKIKPVGGDLTESLTYFDFNIRYATNLNIAFSNIVPNITEFPGINIQIATERTFGGKKYQRFVHNTSSLPSKTYTENVEYTVFSVTLNDPAHPMGDIELAMDLSSENQFPNDYIFSVNKGNGLPITDQVAPYSYFYPAQEHPGGSEYYLARNNVALPLELLDFSGVVNDESFTLNWLSANEVDFEGFELQRSLDGKSFSKIAFIQGKNSPSNNNYSFEDTDFDFNTVYYYRLKLIDLNGEYSYSKTILLSLEKDTSNIKVYPNPSSGIFTLASDPEELEEISIYGLDGKIVKNIKYNKGINPNKVMIDISELNVGLYLLKVKNHVVHIVKSH